MNVSKINISNSVYINPQNNNLSPSTFKGKEDFAKAGITGLTAAAASAVAAINMSNSASKRIINDSDVNFCVTLCGHSNVKNNTSDVNDYRVYLPDNANFTLPIMQKVKIKGKTNTILMFRLHPNTPGLRSGDNMTMQLNADISADVAGKLVHEMEEAGIIAQQKLPSGKIRYFVNSTSPKEFMANPKIKAIIVNCLNEQNKNMSVEQVKAPVTKQQSSYNLKLSDINMVEPKRVQDKENQREVKDYLREFLKNGKKFTVVHDKISENNETKDVTALLIPVKHDWDCLTITLDKNISDEKCYGFIDYMTKAKVTNTGDPKFKSTVLEYFNSL